MKKLTVAAFIIASIGFTGAASAKITDSREESLIRICEALMSDKPIRLKRTMKKAGVTYKQVNEGLVCNGQSAMNFALLHNADKNAGLLARKTSQDIDSLLAKR